MDYIATGMDSSKWYYLRAGQQRGPMNIKALQGLLESGALPSTTLVWTATQPDWQPANATTLLGNHKTREKYKWLKTAAVLFLVLGAGFGFKHFWKSEPSTRILGKTINYSGIRNPTIEKRISSPANIQPGEQQFLDQYNRLQSEHGHLKAAFATLQKSVEEKKNEKTLSAATLLKLQGTNRALADQIEALKENQADPLIKTKYVGLARRHAELENKFSQSNRKRQELEAQLQQKQSNPNQKELTQLTEQLGKVSSELRDKKARISTLEGQLQILCATPPKIQNIRSTSPDTPPTPLARVSSVNLKKGVLVLNSGLNIGFSPGDTLRIISKNNGSFLGYARIQQVLPSRAIANFEGRTIAPLKPGDHIFR